MLLHARNDFYLASAAAEVAIGKLAAVADTSTWLREAGDLQIAMPAAGITDMRSTSRTPSPLLPAACPALLRAGTAHAQALVNLASALINGGRHTVALPVLADAAVYAPSDAHELVGNLEYTVGLAYAELNHVADARQVYARSRAAGIPA